MTLSFLSFKVTTPALSIADFKKAANVTIKVAGELYGNDSDEQKAVQNAWQKVGVI